MTKHARQVLDDALALSDAERAELVNALVRSLRAEDLGYNREDVAEWERRADAIRDGSSETLSSTEVEERMRLLDGSSNRV